MAGPWEKYQQQSEGPWTKYAKQPAPEFAGGMAGAAALGAGDTLSFGFGDEIGASLGAASEYLASKITGDRARSYDEILGAMRDQERRAKEANPVSYMGGQIAGGVVGGVGLAKGGLSMAANAINAQRGLRSVSLASAGDGAALGAIQSFGQGEGGFDQRIEDAAYGGAGGLVVGGLAPSIMNAAGSTVRRAISPFPTNPERTQAVQTLAREGIETTAGQRTGSNGLRYAESEIGGQRAADIFERQGEQFTAAALRRTGTTANRATPDVIDDAFTRIGQQFDDLAARNQLSPDRQLAQDLGSVYREYASLVPETHRAPAIMDTIQDLGRTLGQGNLDGAYYQAARSRLDRLARGAGNDPQLQQALYGIRSALDDGMERSMAVTNPGDIGAWREARNQYRNMLTIERAATGAGEDAALGIVSPSRLRAATVSTQGRRNYARGDGDFAELARAGEAVMKPMPNSGTAGRINAQNMGYGLSTVLGGGAGFATGGDPYSMIAGAIAGKMAPAVAGRAMMSPVAQALFANQAGRALQVPARYQGVFNALVNREQSRHGESVGRALFGTR